MQQTTFTEVEIAVLFHVLNNASALTEIARMSQERAAEVDGIAPDTFYKTWGRLITKLNNM